MTIQVYCCKSNTRFTIINLQHKKERLSYVSMRDYKALCVAVVKCQQHNLIWDKTNRCRGGMVQLTDTETGDIRIVKADIKMD